MHRVIRRLAADLGRPISWLALAVACVQLASAQDWQEIIRAGDIALANRDYSLALERFQSAEQQTAAFAAADPRRAELLVRMARVYRAQGDFAKPEPLYLQAVQIAQKAHGPEAPEYAGYLHEAGYYFHTRRKYDRAEEHYRAAFGVRVRALGREHPDVAESLCHLAILYENQALFDKAETYYSHALAIREKTPGPDHADTILTLEHYARLLYKMNRVAEAQPLSERAQAARKQWVEEARPATAASEIYTSNDSVMPPRLSGRTEPEYTEEARIARQEGTVVLQADISPDGRAGNFRLIRSLGLGLDEMAAEAVRQWEFEPARRGREAVTFRAVLEIQFRVL